MKKIAVPMEKMVIFAISTVLILAIAGVLIVPHFATIAVSDPGTGVPGEKMKYRENAIDFVRENEEMLHRLMLEVHRLPGNMGCLDISRFVDMETYDEPVLRGNFKYVLENEYLESTLENTILEKLIPGKEVWTFSLDYSSGIVTSSVYYDILYCAQDPAPYVEPVSGGTWQEYGNGRLYTKDHVNLYLEEIGNGFWYSYISWP